MTEALVFILIAVVGLYVYLLPAVIAVGRHHQQSRTIAIFTLFTAWTGLGWIVAMFWAAWPSAERQPFSSSTYQRHA